MQGKERQKEEGCWKAVGRRTGRITTGSGVHKSIEMERKLRRRIGGVEWRGGANCPNGQPKDDVLGVGVTSVPLAGAKHGPAGTQYLQEQEED